MGPFTKFKLVVVGLMSLLVGGMSLRAYLVGDGWIHVMFPTDDIGTLKVDGAEVKALDPRNRSRTFLVKQGKHQITVERPSGASASYPLEVSSGMAFMVVPIDDKQCFALLDVTDSRYGNGKGPSKVLQRFTAHAPMAVPDCPYFGEESLPRSVKYDAKMLQDIPCSMASLSDAQLLSALGE